MEPVFWILVICAAVASWLLFFKTRSNRSPKYVLPPGPKGVPLIGHPWIIFGELHKIFTKLGEKWGEIFTVNIFGRTLVVLNSKEIIRDAYNSPSLSEIFAGRPPIPTSAHELLHHSTAFLPPSAQWTRQRKLIHKVLSMYGDGIQAMEDKVHGELKHACNWLNQNQDQPIDMDSVLYPSLINILLILLTGSRREYGSKVLENVRELDESIARLGTVVNVMLMNLFPFARHLPFGLGPMIKINNDTNSRFIKDVYDEAKATFDPEITRGMVDYLLQQQNAMRQEDGSTWLTDLSIKAAALEVVSAGSVTTRSSLSAFFLIVSQHPEVARRIQSEISNVCPGRPPSLRDRSEMSYTMAAILELLRYISHVPVSLLHMTTEDVAFKEYYIPAKTLIATNLWKAHHCDEIWVDPWQFRPERYLGEDGTLLPADHHIRKSTMPFGTGRRSCAGEAFAKSRLFLIVTTLLQKFNFAPDTSRPLPSCDPSDFKRGLITSPPQYFLRVTPR